MNATDKDYEEYIKYYIDSMLLDKTNEMEAHNSPGLLQLEDYIKEYAGDQDYLFSTPLFVSWEFTSACNFRCKHCLYNAGDYSAKNDLSPEKAMAVADELINDFSIVRVSLTGGEIFTRPDIMDIIRKFKENNVALRLLSNAALLNDRLIDELAEIMDPKMDAIKISLDGANEEIYRRVRNTDLFNKVIQNIKRLVDKKVEVCTACALNTINYKEGYDIYKLSCDLGVGSIHFNNMMVLNDSHFKLKIPDREFFKFYYEMKHKGLPEYPVLTFKGVDHDDLIGIPEVRYVIDKYYSNLIKTKVMSPDTRICHYHSAIDISADGTVYPCGETRLLQVAPLGNCKNNSLMEIWENRINNPMLTPCAAKSVPCLKCKYSHFCHGGCPAHGAGCKACQPVV